uniref:GTD-binding domain-containing protein n=1 Tax=Salix viminalis TaxID=40686 RepID=A0A6N2LJB3_SALVM
MEQRILLKASALAPLQLHLAFIRKMPQGEEITMAKRSFKCFVEQELGKLPLFLIYAVLEWVLIAVVFIDGLLAFIANEFTYFANEFTKFFELKIPCLLCTMIDHVLVRRDADLYYNQSICENHKKEISSLAYCHVHKKLRLLKKNAVLNKNIELFVDKKSNLHQGSGCGNPLEVKYCSKGKIAGMLSQAPTPPWVSLVSLRNDQDPRKLDLSDHLRHTELKFSENGSELQDDEDVSNAAHLGKHFTDYVKAAMVPFLTEAESMNEDWTPTITREMKLKLGSYQQIHPPPVPGHLLDFQGNHSSTKLEMLQNPQDLKKQVRLDRRLLMALYMELDEERSSSAVAANNAMAMINRLQAERAAVQMEAMQYERMMEEQAAYDRELLQATRMGLEVSRSGLQRKIWCPFGTRIKNLILCKLRSEKALKDERVK